jgi:magnesium chelatase subunit D
MTPDPAAQAIWADARLAAALFAIDPVGLGGVVIRSGPGPVRDAWLTLVGEMLPADTPQARIPLNIQDDRLLGGLDLPASLAARRPVIERGVLAQSHGGVAILSMAERIEDSVGARLAAVLDTGEIILERDGLAIRSPAQLGLLALDEGAAPDERPPDALMDRLAFHLDLNGLGVREAAAGEPSQGEVADARRRVSAVASPSSEIIDVLCRASQDLGLSSIRTPLLAVRAARAHAAWQGRLEITGEDAVVAARLVLAPRATVAPGESDPHVGDDPPPQPPDQTPDARADDPQEDRENKEGSQADQLIDAVRAVLPDNLLDQPTFKPRRLGRTSRGGGRGSGAAIQSSQRGRPIGSRPGKPRAGERLDLTATLRAAAPWQSLRDGGGVGGQVRVQSQDLRIRRFIQRREATTIFVVDASGSAAYQRLAEAKGAVELLLAKAYVSRTRVALVAFRNTRAEVLLAPTRSLTRAKRQLAEVMGGGGTPMAAGLEAGLDLALAEQAKTRTPILVVLTDGRANIGRDGAPGRAQAETDALAAAQRVRGKGVGGVFIDTSPRARPDGDRFARAMGAVYCPLPYCDAGAVSNLVDGLRAVKR